MEVHLVTALLLALSCSPPAVLAQTTGTENVTIEQWLVVVALCIGIGGIVLCTWIVVIWCICHAECTHRKTERVRKRLQRSSEQRFREHSRGQPAISRSQHDRSIPMATRQAEPSIDRTNTRSPTHIRGHRGQCQPPLVPTLQPTTVTNPIVVITPPRLQLQSLSEAEETDVHPDVSEGPPRYSQIFPVTFNGSRSMDQEDANMSGDQRAGSPFSFQAHQKRGNERSRPRGERSQFNQLSSWPNFK